MIGTRTNFYTLSVSQTDAASQVHLTKVHCLAENVLFEGILSQNVLVKFFEKIVA